MSQKVSISNSFTVNTIEDSQGCCIIARGGCKRENNTYSESSVTIYNGKTTNKTSNSGKEFPADTSGYKRGFALTIINKDTLEVIGRIMYDVYYSAQRVDDLIAELQTISSDYIICICSADYIRWKDSYNDATTLINALKNFGCGEIENPQAGNYPFAFIGRKGMTAGTAIFKLGSRFQVEPVEVKAFVAGGNLLPINEGEKGQQGERGKIGRFYYYGGSFNSGDKSQTFPVNDMQVPFFSHISSGSTSYHAFNPETPTSENYTMSQMWSESGGSWNNIPWVKIESNFKYLITEAIFSNFAHFGGAIINGDWMISQYGKRGDADVQDDNQYIYFDPQYPNESVNTTHTVNEQTWEGYNFVPNYAVDLRTGKTYQHDASITGHIEATSGKIGGFDISGSNLSNTNADEGTNILIQNTNSKSQIGSGIPMDEAGWGAYSASLFSCNHQDTINVAIRAKATGTNSRNYSFLGDGDIVTDGSVIGHKFIMLPSYDDGRGNSSNVLFGLYNLGGVIKRSEGDKFYVWYDIREGFTGSSNIYLPNFKNVAQALRINGHTSIGKNVNAYIYPFAFEITIVFADTMRLWGFLTTDNDNISENGGFKPHICAYGWDNIHYINIQHASVIKLLLLWPGGTLEEKANRDNYRAWVISLFGNSPQFVYN